MKYNWIQDLKEVGGPFLAPAILFMFRMIVAPIMIVSAIAYWTYRGGEWLIKKLSVIDEKIEDLI